MGAMGAIPRPLSGRHMKVQAPHSLLATRPASIHGQSGVACQCAFVLCGAEATSMLLWLAAGAAVNLRSCCVGSANGFTPGLLFSGSATKGVPAPLELQSRPMHRCGMEERVWITRLGSWPLALLWVRPGSRRRRRCGFCLRRTAGISASARNPGTNWWRWRVGERPMSRCCRNRAARPAILRRGAGPKTVSSRPRCMRAT